MSIFVDTSAFYAILDADDENHGRAKRLWIDLVLQKAHLVCSNYVLVETFALVQHRLGLQAIRTFQVDVLPLLQTEWVGEVDHQAGVTAVLTAARRRLSLVDCVSFEIMRQWGMKQVFTFDLHFAEQGFMCIPRE